MKMICESTGSVLNVQRHYILVNGWEYYLEKPDEDGISFGLVMGDETELGDVSIDEIRPYILTVCEPKDSDEIFPAEGWQWQEEENE